MTELICALNRVLFALSLNADSMMLDFTNAPSFPVVFERLFQMLIKENLLLKVSGVRSTFGSVMTIKPQMQVVATEWRWPVPNTILRALSNSVGVKQAMPVDLYVGYLGRTWEIDDSRFVSDGLASEKNDTIYLDLSAHMVYPLETTGWRITHELLHTLGLSEEEECGYDWRVYLSHKNLINTYAQEIKSQMPSIKETVDTKCKQIEIHNVDLVQTLWEMCDSLAMRGLTLPGRDMCFAKSFVPVFPANGNPLVDIAGFDIPFA